MEMIFRDFPAATQLLAWLACPRKYGLHMVGVMVTAEAVMMPFVRDE